MITQKLYKNGNSIAMTIPKELLHELSLRDGSEVVLKKRGKELVVASKINLAEDVDTKFTKMVDEFIEDHHDVLLQLSKR